MARLARTTRGAPPPDRPQRWARDLLATEPDHTRRDFRPLVEAAGYELIVDEPVIDDPAVRELLRVHDHFMLFRRPA